jgi:hypothetical protein
MTPTIGDLIAKHNELMAFLEGEAEAFDKTMKPYREGIEAIKGAILGMLQEQGVQNFKTDHGTAYQVTIMSAKVDNRVDFLNHVKQGAWDMLDARALKEPVKDWLDAHNGVPPPGVKIDFVTKCNIRRT